MNRPVIVVVLVGLMLPAATAGAQFASEGELFALGAAQPFKASVDRRGVRITSGRELEIPVVLEAAEKHKLYRDKVRVSFPGDSRLEGVRVTIPRGREVDDPAFGPGTRILEGRNVLLVTASLKEWRPGRLHLEPKIEYQGCSDIVCFPLAHLVIALDVELAGDPLRVRSAEWKRAGAKGTDELGRIVEQLDEEHDFSRTVERRGYLLALLSAFATGLLVSLTPCVWPLIPIVLAAVGASAEGAGWKRGLRLSGAYVLGISITYAVLGAIAGLIGASVQAAVQSPWLIGLVCLVFVALALSMFGLYDIRMPSALSGRLQRKGTGFFGIVLMGIVSGVVASPCVSAPLLGLFAGIATLGSIWVGVLAGFLFAWGMGVILVVAGTSSKALQSLPGSGEWMVSVKRFFGWVMLGVAIYFGHMVVGSTAYRFLMGTLLLAFGVFFLGALGPGGVRPSWANRLRRVLGALVVVVAFVYFLVGPWLASRPVWWVWPGARGGAAREGSIAWVSSVEEGLARADAEGKPALIDFWAEWCTYCHQMDREVFSKGSVIAESRRFVMIKRDVTIRNARVDALYRRYRVQVPPAFVFVQPGGRHETVNRKLDLDAFLALMRATR